MSADKEFHELAKFIAEVALLDYNLAHILPSKVAGTAFYMASKVRQIEFPKEMLNVMEMSEAELISLARKFAPAIQHWTGQDVKLQSLKSKFDKLYPDGQPSLMKRLEIFVELESVPEE